MGCKKQFNQGHRNLQTWNGTRKSINAKYRFARLREEEEGELIEQEKEEAKRLRLMGFTSALVQSGKIEWKEEGDLEWGFDRRIGRFIIKEKGKLENHVNGSEESQTRDFTVNRDTQ